ncbi:MAG: hypothetical protein IT233_04490 [Bacteroidia bacterium]|nr:hypothetical protein [Bacteroidia bacterium]
MDYKEFIYDLTKQEDELLLQEKEIQEVLAHIQAVKAYYQQLREKEAKSLIKNGSPTTSLPKKNVFPATYHKNLTQRQKTYIALKMIISGDTNAMASAYHRMEPSTSVEVAKGIVTFHASSLAKDGFVGAKKEGYKNLYFIKVEKNQLATNTN